MPGCFETVVAAHTLAAGAVPDTASGVSAQATADGAAVDILAVGLGTASAPAALVAGASAGIGDSWLEHDPAAALEGMLAAGRAAGASQHNTGAQRATNAPALRKMPAAGAEAAALGRTSSAAA